MEASGAERAERQRAFDFSRLQKAEYFGFAAALVLAASLFLPWFSTSGNASIQGTSFPEGATAFDVYNSLDWLLVAACSAPFILAYIIVRSHSLSWRPGEVTAIVGLTAFVLILCNGIILGRPGESFDIGLGIGYFAALLASAGLLAAGYLRQSVYGDAKKPPGTI